MKTYIKRTLAIFLCLALILTVLCLVGGGQKKTQDKALSLWTEGAKAKEALVDYVQTVTDAESDDFIPVEDRIAVFDLDGTLFCETDPNYFDYTLLAYRVLEDPDYKDKAKFEGAGVAAIIYTDIDRDGVLTGINWDSTIDLAEAVSIPVIASGGLASIADIVRMTMPDAARLEGAISGRALSHWFEGPMPNDVD